MSCGKRCHLLREVCPSSRSFGLEKIRHLGDCSIAGFVGSIDDDRSCNVVVFYPSEDECVVVFDVTCDDGQCSSNGNCLERNKNGGAKFPYRHCACHELVASVVAVRHLLCIVGHHDGGGREYSGSGLRGACVSLIRG